MGNKQFAQFRKIFFKDFFPSTFRKKKEAKCVFEGESESSDSSDNSNSGDRCDSSDNNDSSDSADSSDKNIFY